MKLTAFVFAICQFSFAAYFPNVIGSSLVRQRLEWAKIGNGGTPAVGSQSGGISSVTDNGTGDSTLNYQASFWTVAPTCACTVLNANADDSARTCTIKAATSTTAVRVFTQAIGAAGGGLSTIGPVDNNYEIHCMGTR